MSVHLQREIEELKKHILAICALVEEQVQLAVRAFIDRDADLARQVQDRDKEIDLREVEVEEDCLKVLALYQPVAIDLRLIVSTLTVVPSLAELV
jgi:phosphate transport system protein